MPAKDKLKSELQSFKYVIEMYIKNLDEDYFDTKELDKFLYDEIPNSILPEMQYALDEILEEENPPKSIEIDNWRITNKIEINSLNELFNVNHVFYEVEDHEEVDINSRAVDRFTVVIGDGKTKYYPNEDDMRIIHLITAREPDIVYSPKK